MPLLTDTDVSSWRADYLSSDNNSPSNGSLINQQLDDQVRNIMSVVRAEAENRDWQRLGEVPTYISATSFSLSGDQTDTAIVGRRIKATISGGTKYGTILTSSYSSGITTVTCRWDYEEYTANAFTRTNANTISFTGVNTVATFPANTKVEFWNDSPASAERVLRVVSNSAFATNTTVNFATGDPYLPIETNHDRLIVPSSGITNTVSEVQFGTFTPDIYESGWGHSAATGAFQITANNTAGPFTVSLPKLRANNTYTVQVQALSANTAPSNTNWVQPQVTSRSISNFAVTLPASINTGAVMTYAYCILEQA